MFRVLIVEDDVQLCRQLSQLLEREFLVTYCATIQSCEETLEKIKVDLLLLDRLVSDGDTIELLSYVRECSPSTRILMMSSLGKVGDRVEGLTQGADDYLSKPIEPTELLLRTRRLLQFERSPSDHWLSAGELQLNRTTGEVCIGKRLIHLRPRETQILSCLLQFKNRVVTRESIMNNVWGTTELPTNSTLDVYLRRLRILLGDAATCIKTVRGFGYLIQDSRASYK